MRTGTACSAIEIAIWSYGQRGDSGLPIGNQIHRAIAEITEIDPCLRDNDAVISGISLRKRGEGEYCTKENTEAGSIHE
jgi:hypothetical protein